MKVLTVIAPVFLLLALDWAALHDILKGEPNLILEYGMLGFSLVAFGSLAYIGLRKKGQ